MLKFITSLLPSVLSLALALTVSVGLFADHPTTDTQAQWMKATAPGEAHNLLKDLTGKWKHNVKFWMDPAGKPEESKGTTNSKLIMGGRFLQTDHTGKAMGKPFQGMGLLGYDNVKGEYQTAWVDNMTTGIMTATATYDPTTKTITETGTYACPMSGEKSKWYKGEWKLIDKNNYTYSMYNKSKEGAEYKSMEINYKRM